MENLVTNLPKLIQDKIAIQEDGCWYWTGALGGKGQYGTFTKYIGEGQTQQYVAHRLIFTYYAGPIPQGYHLHHICSVNKCVRPEHLELKTPQDHKLHHMMEKTHCKSGHPFDEKNTYINTRNQRECKECRREAVRQWRQRERR